MFNFVWDAIVRVLGRGMRSDMFIILLKEKSSVLIVDSLLYMREILLESHSTLLSSILTMQSI